MRNAWRQPDHMLGAPTYFKISCSFRWPSGWHGSLVAQLEGEPEPVTLIKWSELTTDQLWPTLLRTITLVGGLIDADELPLPREL